MKNNYSRHLIALFGTVVLTLVASATASAFDSCRNVRFTIRNDRNGVITLKQVKYFNANEGEWKEEDIPNTELQRGWQHVVSPQDLQGAEGERLTKIKFVYEDHNDRQTKTSGEFIPTSPECVADKNYGYGQGWAITGSSAVQDDSNPLTGDKCKSVKVKFDNGRDGDIKIKKVKFYNKNSGDWKTEDVLNSTCEFGKTNCYAQFGATSTYLNVNDSNGEDLTKIVLVYEYRSKQRGSNWSDPIESKTFQPSSPTCKEGKVYGEGQGWVVGNDAATTSSTSTEAARTSGSTDSSTTNSRRRRRNNTTGTITNESTTDSSGGTTTSTNRRRTTAIKPTETIDPAVVTPTTTPESTNKRRARRKKPVN